MQSARESVFESLELGHILIQHQDTMQQVNNLLRLRRSIEQLPDSSQVVEKIKGTIHASKIYISEDISIQPHMLNLDELIRLKEWVRILAKWREYMINPEVTVSTLIAFSNRQHHAGSHMRFVHLMRSRLNVYTAADRVAQIAGMIDHGLFNLVEEAMRRHNQDSTLVRASVEFLLDWFLMMNLVNKEFIFHLKIVGGIVQEIANEENEEFGGSGDLQWVVDLFEEEGGEAMSGGPNHVTTFILPYFIVRELVDNFVREYEGAPDDVPLKDSEKAQLYMDACARNGVVYQRADLRPIVYQVIQWLHTLAQHELQQHGRTQIRGLALLQNALNTNNTTRMALIECGLVPFIVRQISSNNHKAMLLRNKTLVAQFPCEYTPCQFAYYSLLYALMASGDNDVIVAELCRADAMAVIINTLREASMQKSPFAFELAGVDRKDVYYVGHMNCYKTMENGVPVHNISELAFVALSRMCIPGEYTVDSRQYIKNMAYFQRHGGPALLKLGLLSFTNVEQSTNARHNSMSDEDHNERLANLSNLELMALHPDSRWMAAHAERRNALSNVLTEEMQAM